MVNGCFRVLAMKNERISLNDKPKQYFGKSHSDSATRIPILCSDIDNPKTGDDGELLGAFRVPNWGSEIRVVVQFHFYGTMFAVSYYDRKGKTTQKLHINYGK